MKPDVGIETLSVTEVTDRSSLRLARGPNFPDRAMHRLRQHAAESALSSTPECTGATCTNVNYDVVTSYDVPDEHADHESRIPEGDRAGVQVEHNV